MATTQSVEQEQDAAQQGSAAAEVSKAEFTEARETDVAPGEENLDLLLDVQMPLTVIMGRTIMSFKKLLQLGPGSVIQLDKTVGQPADLYIQDIRFATADLVVVDDCFAVRIKEILGVDQNELRGTQQA
ncbi:MAG: FliM/FliN family flagellar motor switch protein [Phycisphaerae bacterium]|nr:FliM/FliN family flagellar motor switch protein [Phycisphaerae bacterium]